MPNLLLLEDDLSLIDGLTYSLNQNGFTVDVARTVAQARERLDGPVRIDLTASRVFLHGEPLEVTGMEYRLLCLFLQNAGLTLPRQRIMDVLWDGSGDFVDDNTLSVYIRRLREKIEPDPSRPVYLVTVRGFGYQWRRDAP